MYSVKETYLILFKRRKIILKYVANLSGMDVKISNRKQFGNHENILEWQKVQRTYHKGCYKILLDELKWELYPNWHRIYKNAVLQAKDVASNVFMKNKEGGISSKETSTWSTLKTTNFNKARRETQELKLNREKKKCWKNQWSQKMIIGGDIQNLLPNLS